MKVILSRKGFDSSNGGFPSLILPENEEGFREMISLPIPCSKDYFKYSEITTKNGKTLFDIMKQYEKKIKEHDKKKELNEDTYCHLDPFLGNYSTEETKKNKWKGIFGQEGNSAAHLSNNSVEEGDIFIFFGWFDDIIKNKAGNYQYVNYVKGKKNSENQGRHTMFGYLQIDKILYPKKNDVPSEYNKHPHIFNEERKENDRNVVFIAKDTCSFNENIKGYGMFNYDEDLDLTQKKVDKTYCKRTRWKVLDVFNKPGTTITYHKNSMKENGTYFQSNNIGQEFVIKNKNNPTIIENWAIKLIEKYSANRIK